MIPIVFHSDFEGNLKIPSTLEIIRTNTPATKILAAVKVSGSILVTKTTNADKLKPHIAITKNNNI